MKRNESLRKHISDMLAVEEHILKAIRQQLDDDRVTKHAQARQLIHEIERVLNRHVTTLKDLASQYDADTQSLIKGATERLTGLAAGLYDKVRSKHPLSRDLRDDYTALSLAAMSYTTFHAYGLTIKEEHIANLALDHLKELTPLLVEISKLLPEVVVAEVHEENDFPTDNSVGPKAVKNTQQAWSTDVTEGAKAE